MIVNNSDKLATLFYVAHALPLVRSMSEEAAIMTELALSELILSLLGRKNTLKSHTGLVDYLNYSIEDVQTIAPAAATALRAAMRELREVPFDVDAEEERRTG
ncbi:hypothetical protein [Aureimonas leprariae]|uniref:Uncharacterized protein n=1 Tax=Plantimonas leprariae TaxID=2615207 RepID=A0A7V7TUI1_9HYPH|nr:hypothetical protein [Aureimonas leprariae]KAB0676401.1 hypothetical protein F6X38_21125 [Aureimonas leprariae]